MAASSFSSKIIISFAYIILLIAPSKQALACFKSIISFGDSLADTGNVGYLNPPSKPPPASELPPYGVTFFHRPTGRSSDGRLIIDFIAEDFGLPLIPPFHGGKKNVSGGGVNFAVYGATALADPFFAKNGVQIQIPNVSLSTQLTWFKGIFLPSFCYHKSANCENFLEASLVLVGEIGGNDYNDAFLQGKSVDVVKPFVPQVVKEINLAINELIKLGAMTLMVPGNMPIGCSAAYLTYFNNSDVKDYDPETGCLNWLNEFSQYHNELLRFELDRIQRNNPNVNIIYADYYNAAMLIYRSPHKYGFTKGALRACCGRGGPYNMDLKVGCGMQGTSTCENPSFHVSWDGLHLTEAAYRWIATFLLRGSFTVPQIKSVCSMNNATAAAVGFSDH